MAGRKLYEARCLELMKLAVSLNVKSANFYTRQPSFANDADAIHLPRSEKEPQNVQMVDGDMVQEVVQQHEKDIENMAWRGDIRKTMYLSMHNL